MPKKRDRPSQATNEFLIPQPNEEDVEKMRDLYRRRTGEEVGFDEARDALSKIVRYQWMNIVINSEHERGLREEAESGGSTGAGLEPAYEQITREPGAAEEDADGEGGAGRARGAAAPGVRLEPG